tara:strand:- start:5705 stop:5920 length:216 start_codon:yes stop_codon:yes gene_type:complete
MLAKGFFVRLFSLRLHQLEDDFFGIRSLLVIECLDFRFHQAMSFKMGYFFWWPLAGKKLARSASFPSFILW